MKKLPLNLKLKTLITSKRVVFIILFFSSIGIVTYAYRQSQPQAPIDTGKVRETSEGNIITNDFAVIPTQIVPFRKKTVITIPFKPPKERVEVWLSLRLKDEGLINSLMSHPDLNSLTWEYVGNDRYTLYQKNKSYATVETFLKDPPKDATVQADPDIIKAQVLSSGNISELASTIDLNQVDYILTSYKPHYIENEWRVFKSVFDATDAYINEDTMYWTLTMKGVSVSNPFIFKRVFVDYSQPANQNNIQQIRIQ
jgi:hypothetical protein